MLDKLDKLEAVVYPIPLYTQSGFNRKDTPPHWGQCPTSGTGISIHQPAVDLDAHTADTPMQSSLMTSPGLREKNINMPVMDLAAPVLDRKIPPAS